MSVQLTNGVSTHSNWTRTRCVHCHKIPEQTKTKPHIKYQEAEISPEQFWFRNQCLQKIGWKQFPTQSSAKLILYRQEQSKDASRHSKPQKWGVTIGYVMSSYKGKKNTHVKENTGADSGQSSFRVTTQSGRIKQRGQGSSSAWHNGRVNGTYVTPKGSEITVEEGLGGTQEAEPGWMQQDGYVYDRVVAVTSHRRSRQPKEEEAWRERELDTKLPLPPTQQRR